MGSKRRTLLRALLGLFLLIVLSGCTLNARIWVYDNQQWESIIEFRYEPKRMSVMKLMPELEKILPVNDIPIIPKGGTNGVVDTVMDMLIASYGSQGIHAEGGCSSMPLVRERRCLVHLEGWEWNQIEFIDPSGSIQVTPLKDGEVEITLEGTEVNPYLSPWFKEQITIYGGKILQSNAPERGKNWARWRNPTEIKVILTPGHRGTFQGLKVWWYQVSGKLSMLLRFLMVIFVVVFLGWLLWRFQRKNMNKEWEDDSDWGNDSDWRDDSDWGWDE